MDSEKMKKDGARSAASSKGTVSGTETRLVRQPGKHEEALTERKPAGRQVIETWPKRMPEKKAEMKKEAGLSKQESGKQQRSREEKLRYYGQIGQWFQTLCWIKIPVFGFFYMLVLAIRKRTPLQKKTFAIAYVLYRLLVMILALTILFVLYKVGLSFLDEILRYAGS